MDDIPLLHGMEQLETVILNTFRNMPKGFRQFIIKKVTDKSLEDKDSGEQFVGMLALYGLAHTFQLEKKLREDT